MNGVEAQRPTGADYEAGHGHLQLPTPATAEDQFEDFYEWVAANIEKAKKGSYVTLDSLELDLLL